MFGLLLLLFWNIFCYGEDFFFYCFSLCIGDWTQDLISARQVLHLWAEFLIHYFVLKEFEFYWQILCEWTHVLCSSCIWDIGFLLSIVPSLDLLVLCIFPPTPSANITIIRIALGWALFPVGFIQKFGRLERVCLGLCICEAETGKVSRKPCCPDLVSSTFASWCLMISCL